MPRHFASFLLFFLLTATAPLYALPFQNFDFEQAIIQPFSQNVDFLLVANTALPGWTAKYDSTVTATIFVQPTLDSTSVALVDNQPYFAFPSIRSAMFGNFSVNLLSYNDPRSPRLVPWISSIHQVGDVPANARTLEFYTRNIYLPNPFVYMDSNLLELHPLSTSQGITLWAADVTSYAGATHELAFAAVGPSAPISLNEDVYDLDNISFSPLTLEQLGVVPEPTSAFLLATPATLLFRRQRTRLR